MLNKAACKCCYGAQWNYAKERRWEDDKRIVCDCVTDRLFVNINEPPPPDCPYTLDHLMNEETNASQ